MGRKKKRKHSDETWAEAKKRHRLSDEHVQKAKMLGLNPKKFNGYAPNKAQPWKRPISEFIDRIYARQFGSQKPKMPKKKAVKGGVKKASGSTSDKASTRKKVGKQPAKKKRVSVQKKYHHLDATACAEKGEELWNQGDIVEARSSKLFSSIVTQETFVYS